MRNELSIQRRDVVILAAGESRRMADITAGTPKCFIHLAYGLVLDYVLNFAKHLLSDGELFVVANAAFASRFREHQRSSQETYPYTLIFVDPEGRENLNSLLTAFGYIQDSFFLLNADHIFPIHAARSIETVVGDQHLTIICDTDRELGDDDMKVRFADISHNMDDISKSLEMYNAGYVGITFVPKVCLNQYKLAAAELAKNTHSRVENILQALAWDEVVISCGVLNGLKWYELDTPEDLKVVRSLAPSEHRLFTTR